MKKFHYVIKNEALRWARENAIAMPFCFTCFDELPHDIKKGLYKKPGQGFEAAYEQAIKVLK
jgi:hypothetical protein